MKEPTWYLLYGGSSVDGCGPGVYEGRTVDPKEAKAHFLKIKKNWYSTGKVLKITDTTEKLVMNIKEID